MAALLSAMLNRFHHHIVDQETHRRYSVWDLLESVRAVRDARTTELFLWHADCGTAASPRVEWAAVGGRVAVRRRGLWE